MRAFKHKEHNVYSISKNAVIIRRKVGGRIKFFFPKAVKRYGLIGSVKNFKLYIRPHNKGGVFKMDVQKQLLIKELRKYLDRAEKDDTTYCELLMEIPELLEIFNCGLN